MTLVNNGSHSAGHCSTSDIDILKPQPKGCSTPVKDMIFPETSYHTPENQKYVYKIPDSEIYQTMLYVAPEDHQNQLRQKVAQKENFVEVIVPPSIPNETGLYEITTKDTKEFVFNPKIENFNTRKPLEILENRDQNALLNWKNKMKHGYDCNSKKDNLKLSENTVINLRKSLLFEDCDNVLSRPKKICKRNRSSDITLKDIPSSPFSKIINGEHDSSASRSEIRRKLNYSSDLSFQDETFDVVEPEENNHHFPTSVFTKYASTSEKTDFNFAKPARFAKDETSRKHKFTEYGCKYCTRHKENSGTVVYKSNFVPSSPMYNELGEPLNVPKSPKMKHHLSTNEETPKKLKIPDYFKCTKLYSPIKSHPNKFASNQKDSPKKCDSFKFDFKVMQEQKSTSSKNTIWKFYDDSKKGENDVPEHSKFKLFESTTKLAKSPLRNSTNLKFSPGGEKEKCCPFCLRSPKRNKYQVVPLSPSEYMLRKKVLPHTVTSDMKPKNVLSSPVFKLF